MDMPYLITGALRRMRRLAILCPNGTSEIAVITSLPITNFSPARTSRLHTTTLSSKCNTNTAATLSSPGAAPSSLFTYITHAQTYTRMTLILLL
jgi:hypothetical protein